MQVISVAKVAGIGAAAGAGIAGTAFTAGGVKSERDPSSWADLGTFVTMMFGTGAVGAASVVSGATALVLNARGSGGAAVAGRIAAGTGAAALGSSAITLTPVHKVFADAGHALARATD